jgi:hypothetical protein
MNSLPYAWGAASEANRWGSRGADMRNIVAVDPHPNSPGKGERSA